MNAPQRDLILELLREACVDDSELAEAIARSDASSEPHFVTNLESVQGDERDYIIICCTYGPEAEGLTPSNQFGPITSNGGERRLNVLFTRARRRMTVLASLHPHDITASSAGARHFRGFLEFSRDRKLTQMGKPASDRTVNGFEASVVRALTNANYRVQCQVGVSGFFIDAAVEDPKCEGRFILGIECDGATYHSSRTARERDRLRQEVLETQGWRIYRVWSTDWFHDRVSAERRLLQAVDERLRAVREEEVRIETEAQQAVAQQPDQVPSTAADEEEIFDADVESAGGQAQQAGTDPSPQPPQQIPEDDPETVSAARIIAAIIAALQGRSYLKREALLKEVCKSLQFQIRSVRRSQFSKRMWRLTRGLARKGITRIGGTNNDCAALVAPRLSGQDGALTRLAV